MKTAGRQPRKSQGDLRRLPTLPTPSSWTSSLQNSGENGLQSPSLGYFVMVAQGN